MAIASSIQQPTASWEKMIRLLLRKLLFNVLKEN